MDPTELRQIQIMEDQAAEEWDEKSRTLWVEFAKVGGFINRKDGTRIDPSVAASFAKAMVAEYVKEFGKK